MQVEWAETVNHQTAVSSDECTASESQMVCFALSHNFRVNPSGVLLEVNNVNKVVYGKRKSVGHPGTDKKNIPLASQIGCIFPDIDRGGNFRISWQLSHYF